MESSFLNWTIKSSWCIKDSIFTSSKGCSMVKFAFLVLNTWRVSKLLDKCLLRFDITTDSFVIINLLSAASDNSTSKCVIDSSILIFIETIRTD